MNLTDPDSPAIVDALTRKCVICQAVEGIPCVCTLPHLMPHMLAECTPNPRIVHHARLLPTPKGGD